MKDILVIKNIKKLYHDSNCEIEAIRNISLNIKEGEIVAIVGPSGCGKSTLLSILCNLDKQSEGVIINSNNVKISYMPQNDCLFDWLNIIDNCLIGLKVEGKLNCDTKSYVESLLETYGLKEFAKKYPKNLSGGMRQRTL
ncbi:MAG: ATP-binding cassette domain-containing protein [bacterium]|nr:ATP-binding cassette domain-containing protein [bacterium]